MLSEPDEEVESEKSEQDKEMEKVIDFTLGITTAIFVIYTARTELK